jgi:hypothetical protein
MNRARGTNVFWRKPAVLITSCVVMVAVSVGVAAGVVGPGLVMQAGETDHVACAGSWLSVTNRDKTSLDLRCATGRDRNTDPTPNRSSTDPTPNTSSTDTTTTTSSTDTTTTSSTDPTAATTTTTTTSPAGGTTPSWWQPPTGNVPWQWEIDHPLDLTSAADMGTGATLPDGQPAPDPVVYDIDGILNPASTVAALHAKGDHAICYIEVGTAGNYYSAGEEGISTTYYDQLQAAGEFGDQLNGYPEYFLNITSSTTVGIIESMIQQQCAAKGFDAVETDLDETYSGSDGTTGFIISQQAEQTYMTTLADYMHSLGMGWIAKNLDDTGDSFATLMEPVADAIITEQCNQYGTCGALSAYEGQKAVFNAEYDLATSAFCPADNALGFNGAVFPVELNGGRSPCR